ncbi:hypothetical protein [Salicibibacter halophilus]|uniref:hypothetical protein n=1 Tax=Salicibibacter halophilus TaxID=2502791 RepID=UPI001D04D282|nr:hypothetical protein [Salicibibacter halophilus]
MLLMLTGFALMFILLLFPDMNLLLWLMIIAASIVANIAGVIRLIKFVRQS